MVNRRRGEIKAHLDGEDHVLCLTLGALAELEAAFGDDDLVALAGRLSNGRLSATDVIRIIGAGLRGAGAAIEDHEVAVMQVDGGASGYLAIVSDLLSAAFPSSAGQLE